MSNTILRSEAMRIIRSGQPFNMEYVTADRRRGTGGELKEVKRWMIVKNETTTEKLPGKNIWNTGKTSKDPLHHQHKTFNIFNPAHPKDRPQKVHFRLIQTFNGKRVING